MDGAESQQQRVDRVERELAVARAIVTAELDGYALDADGVAAPLPMEPAAGALPEEAPEAVPADADDATEPDETMAFWSPSMATLKNHYAALFPDLPFDTGIVGDVHEEAAAMARDASGIRIFTVRPIEGGPPEQIVISLDTGQIIATSS